MKPSLLPAHFIWIIALCATIHAQPAATTASAPMEKIETDVLRPVTPDDRQDADLLYWHFTKLMAHGVMVMPARGPVKAIVVDFSVFPIWADRQETGVVSVKLVLPDNRAEPRSFWEIKESVRLLPKPLLERLEKTWDRALTTARVQSRKGTYVSDGAVYEFRGGEGSDRYVVQTHSPSSGVPAAIVHLTDALIDYCGSDGSPPREDTKIIEESLDQLEKALPIEAPKKN